MTAIPQDWLVPDWPAPARVHALFTMRSGGVSQAPFDSFNLGDHVRDDPVAVATNRTRLRGATGVRPVFLAQVHGAAVAELDADTADGTEADACLSTRPGVACTIMVADCLPVLFSNTAGTAVAASHAGWRGLAGEGATPAGQGVLEATFDAFVRAVQRTDPAARHDSVAVNTLVAMEVFYLFSVRYLKSPSFTWQGVQGTPLVLLSVGAVWLLQLLFTYAPFMNVLFESRPLGWRVGVAIVAAGAAVLVILELEKAVLRRLWPAQPTADFPVRGEP